MSAYRLLEGDCLDHLKTLEDASIDSIVTDPPYGLGFMGKKWDIGVPAVDVFAECLRVLRPGGHLLAFGGSRTYHRLAVAVEDAGFEIRDQIMWVYGSGFPKSRNVGKEVDGWDGWGTALKPAHEPIVVARKPLSGTVASNVLDHGTGALNIDGCRIEGTVEGPGTTPQSSVEGQRGAMAGAMDRVAYDGSKGRWPANLIHDGSDEVTALFPDSKGQQGDVRGTESSRTGGEGTNCYGEYGRVPAAKRGDTGSAARFFYAAKASKRDRTEGGAVENQHPTVKPTDLMRYLCRLVTPPGGTVLDPFTGSGSTGKAAALEGFDFIGVEKEADYLPTARARIEHAGGVRAVNGTDDLDFDLGFDFDFDDFALEFGT